MSEKLPPGTLCAVCEDVATGNHYSVASCNGCKTFFRRAIVNKRNFVCMGNGNCPVNKGVRCACRHCRLKKCLAAGMSTNAIQNDRDRIGYTKRTKKGARTSNINNKVASIKQEHDDSTDHSSHEDSMPSTSANGHSDPHAGLDSILERLTALENNFTLLLSRAHIEPYASLGQALAEPSRFHGPMEVKISDPIVTPGPEAGDDQKKMPFWRSRIIALYIDWAKSFPTFRNLPQSDKIALITNHASSYMIMCEMFRTPEHTEETEIASNFLKKSTLGYEFKEEPRCHVESTPTPPDMIRLPTEYGTLPPDYGAWLPADYGCPVTGREGRSNMHAFFDREILVEGSQSDENVLPKPGEASMQSAYPIVGSLFSLSGLTPVMSCMIDYVMKPFRQLNISTTEFATLQAIMFFDPDTEGIDSASQRNVSAEQKKLIGALFRYISANYDSQSAHERFSSILLRIPTIRKVAAKKNESLQIIDMFNLFALNSLVKETVGIRSNPGTPSCSSKMHMQNMHQGSLPPGCEILDE